MTLIFADQRLDLRDLPDLMPQRRGIRTGKCSAAATAIHGLAGDDFLALLAGNQRPLVFGMPRLAAPWLWRLGLRPRWLGVRMLAAGRQRGVARRLLRCRQFRLQRRDPALIMVDQRLHDCPHLRRQGGQLFRCDRRWQGRHGDGFANFRLGAKSNSSSPLPRTVNRYAKESRVTHRFCVGSCESV
jgi:hypothetical protein